MLFTIGSRHDQVRQLTGRLNTLGYLDTVTVNYTESVSHAVRLYQARNGLDVTGQVDQTTYDHLMGGSGRAALAVGDIISTGTYNNTEVKWRVQSITDDTALLVSLSVYDNRPYYNGRGAATWANSSVRNWLNGSFLQTALGNISGALVARDGDRVWLMSADEASAWLTEDERAGCMWWLRDTDPTGAYAAVVLSSGQIITGLNVDSTAARVRPCIMVDLTNASLFR